MQRLETKDHLEAAVGHLTRVEPRFAMVVAQHGLPELRQAEPGLACLLRIVTDQLISLRAGEAIWRRLERRFGGFAPEDVLDAKPGELRDLGLSAAKARTFMAAAKAFSEGGFNEGGISDAELDIRLQAIPGVGPWTSSIYLLTASRAADAWPAADLALQVAAGDLLSLGERPSTSQMEAVARPWRPYRSAAALLLWRHYRGLRGLPRG